MPRLYCLLIAAALAASGLAQAKTLNFSGYAWEVRNQIQSGPGPNDWDENNAWVDAQGRLHLKIAQRGGKWSSSEVYLPQRLGFGRYQFADRPAVPVRRQHRAGPVQLPNAGRGPGRQQ